MKDTSNVGKKVDPRFIEIWDRTLGPAIAEAPAKAERTNGMSKGLCMQFELAGQLSYQEVLEQVKAGKL